MTTPGSHASTCPQRRPRLPGALRPLAALALRRLAAPHLSVLAFVLVAAGALWVAEGGASPTAAMVPPLVLLVANLVAALVTHPRFRVDLPLLVFHLALLAFVGLLVVARLTYLDGTAPVTRGATFAGDVVELERGPWHGDGYKNLRFSNEGFVDEFPANGNEYRTYNRVRWWDGEGNPHLAEIGDDRPLVLDGYRIYATRRGFAPRLLWQPDAGGIQFASMQLGSIEADGWYAGNSWQLPGGPEIWLGLHHTVKRPPPGTVRADLGVADIATPLVVRTAAGRHELSPGQTLALDGGRLTYVRLDAWLGYRIVYDAATPWMIATLALAIASLIFFYVKRIFRRSSPESPE